MGDEDEDYEHQEEEDEYEGEDDGEHEKETPCEKMGNGCFLMCVGCVLFPVMLLLLGWNEKNFVCNAKNIVTAEDKTTELPTSVCAKTLGSSGQEGKFVFFSCPINQTALPPFSPKDFGFRLLEGDWANFKTFSTPVAEQTVEMYQCVQSYTEEKHGKKKRKIYSYKMDWVMNYKPDDGYLADSSEVLIRQGCPQWPIRNVDIFGLGTTTTHASEVKAGPFRINQTLVNDLHVDTGVDVAPLMLLIPARTQIQNPFTPFMELTEDKFSAKTIGTTSYMVTCATADVVNCLRISYRKNSDTGVAVMANIGTGDVTGPHDMPSAWGCASTPWAKMFSYKAGGALTKDTMLAKLSADNQTQVWIIRLFGILATWLAVYCCFQPISAAVDIIGDYLACIPCIGGAMEMLLEGVVGVILCAVSCMCGVSSALIVIAIVWVVMRPLVGICLLAVAILLIGLGVYLGHQHKEPKKEKKKKKANKRPLMEEEHTDE